MEVRLGQFRLDSLRTEQIFFNFFFKFPFLFPIPRNHPIPHSPFPIPHSPFPIPHSPFPVLVTSSRNGRRKNFSPLSMQTRCASFIISRTADIDPGSLLPVESQLQSSYCLSNISRSLVVLQISTGGLIESFQSFI